MSSLFNCENCYYFMIDKDSKGAPYFYERVCKRYPPQIIQYDGDYKNMYPRTTKEDYCGEWSGKY